VPPRVIAGSVREVIGRKPPRSASSFDLIRGACVVGAEKCNELAGVREALAATAANVFDDA